MQQVESFQDFQTCFGCVKRAATDFSTNIYIAPKQMETWIGRRCLFMQDHGGALLLLRRDRHFFHLYHAAADRTALAVALRAISGKYAETLVTDLVGRAEDVEPWADVYQKSGFAPYRSLVRMTGPMPGSPLAGLEDGVEFANSGDAPLVLDFMEILLDPLVEQIPTLEDLESWARAGSVMLVRHQGLLEGLLIFEASKNTCVLKYWFVDKDARNRGVGARLIRSLFHICRDCRIISLWVIADNQDSIEKYEHYGMRRDSLCDQTYVINGSQP